MMRWKALAIFAAMSIATPSLAQGINNPGVVGPASAVSGHIATFSGTSGKIIQDGGVPGTGTVTSVTCGGVTITTTGTCAPVGQFPGTATNDNAAAGKVGEYISSVALSGSATVTITIASPGVITYTTHGLSAGSPITFTTTGALPTGLTAGTTYYVLNDGNLTANTFDVSATPFGSVINTSGSQSGTQTGNQIVPLVSTMPMTVAAVQLTAGDWQVCGSIIDSPGTSTAITLLQSTISETNNTQATFPNGGAVFNANSFTVNGTTASPVGCKRELFSGTSIAYLIVRATFSVSTESAYGFIGARRMR